MPPFPPYFLASVLTLSALQSTPPAGKMLRTLSRRKSGEAAQAEAQAATAAPASPEPAETGPGLKKKKSLTKRLSGSFKVGLGAGLHAGDARCTPCSALQRKAPRHIAAAAGVASVPENSPTN